MAQRGLHHGNSTDTATRDEQEANILGRRQLRGKFPPNVVNTPTTREGYYYFHIIP